MVAAVLPFRPRAAAVSVEGLPARHAEIGQLWIEGGPGGIWKVEGIRDVGPNAPGQWPKVVRDVLIVPMGEQPEMTPRAAAARRRDRWIREKKLLTSFSRPAEDARDRERIRADIPAQWHGFFGLDEAKGGELLGARPEDAPAPSTRAATSYYGLGQGKGRLILRLVPGGRMGVEGEVVLPLMPAAAWLAVADALERLDCASEGTEQLSAGGFRILVGRESRRFTLEVRGRSITIPVGIARELRDYVRQSMGAGE